MVETSHNRVRSRVPAGGTPEGRIGGLFVLDQQGYVRYCDRDLALLLGYEPTEICHRSVREFLPELGMTPSGEADLSILAAPGPHSLAIVPAWGQPRPVELRCHDLGAQGHGMLVMEVRDALPATWGEDWTNMLRRIYHAREPIMITDRHGLIEYVNPRYETLSGFRTIELLGCHTTLASRRDSEEEGGPALQARLMTGERLGGVMVNFAVNGEGQCVEADVRPFVGTAGAVCHFVCTVREGGHSKRELEELAHAANHDALTELPNRRLFLDRFQQALKGGSRYGLGCTLAFMDVDNLKIINDNHGHGAGDVLLKAVAVRIRDSIREVDTVARLGGDEFGLILVDTADFAAATKVFDKILDSLPSPLSIGDARIDVSLSIGACFCPAQGGNPQTYLDQADKAMYSAKRAGGNRYNYYSQIVPWRRNQAEGESEPTASEAPQQAKG